MRVDLFISHSSGDVDLATRLIRLVDGLLEIPNGAIRCTSVPGYRLEPGDDGPERLRENLRDAKVILGILTPSSLGSAYVLMELGAGWGLNSRVIPLVAGGAQFGDIPGPIGRNIHAASASRGSDVWDLIDAISKYCGMPWRSDVGQLWRQIDSFTVFAQSYTSSVESGVKKESIGRLDEPLEAVLALLGAEACCRSTGWLSNLTGLPVGSVRHLLETLSEIKLVRGDSDPSLGWELTRAGREYAYRWKLSTLRPPRPSRRTPPYEVELIVRARSAKLIGDALLANVSPDGRGLGIISTQAFDVNSEVLVRIPAVDRTRDFEAKVIRSHETDDGAMYMGLQVLNPIAHERIVSVLDTHGWKPSTIWPGPPKA